jgi:hypothetical protein
MQHLPVGPVAVVVVDIVAGLHKLVLLWQENGGDEPVGLGDIQMRSAQIG